MGSLVRLAQMGEAFNVILGRPEADDANEFVPS